MQQGPSGLSLAAGIGNAVVGGFSSAQAAGALPGGQNLPGNTPFVPPSPAGELNIDGVAKYASPLNMQPYAPFAP